MDRLEENFATLRRLVPTRRIQLGIYLYDFGGKKEMDVRCLERQLAFGLARWRRGEIEGFVFLCSSLCNRDTPAVRFVRDWLKQHGDETRMCRFDDGKGGYDIVEWKQLDVAGGKWTPVRAFLYERYGGRQPINPRDDHALLELPGGRDGALGAVQTNMAM